VTFARGERGPLAAMALGAALISTSAVFVEWVRIGPTASAFWRVALAAAMLSMAFARPALRAGWRPPPRVLALVALAAAFFALDLWMWHRSILYAGVGLATLLGNFQVFALAGFGALAVGEHCGWRLWAGLLLALAGLALLLAPGWGAFDARFRLGVAYGLGTAVAYAGFLLAFRAAQARRAGTSNEALPPQGARDWAALLAYALIAQVFGWLVIGKVMPKLAAGVLGLCLLLQPLLAYVWDALLFGTRLGPVELLGLALSLAGIFLGLTRRRAS
jgi:drug/metabolite transporter (DMT)-like permease